MAIVIDAPRVEKCRDCVGYLRCKGWTDEPYACPIVGEIPDKHGDLKDTADIMQRYEHEIVKLKAELPKEEYEQIFRVFHVFVKPWIDQAPTVLEASK